MEEIIRKALQSLRADLMATNKACAAIVSTMPIDQHEAVLRRFAQLSLLNEETVAAMPKQVAPETLQSMREAEDRMYRLLAGAKGMPPGQARPY